MTFRSNDLSVKWAFGQVTIFWKKLSVKWTFGQLIMLEKAFGQMNFRSNDLVRIFFSVKWLFFFESRFGQMTILWKKRSVKWTFGWTAIRSNGVRSNDLSVKKFRWNDFSVKWSRTVQYFSLKKSFRSKDFSKKWPFGQMTEKTFGQMTLCSVFKWIFLLIIISVKRPLVNL
jgi:hypothetical protein